MISLAALNAMPPNQFAALLAHLFEHSPWIPQRTAAQKPFPSLAALHAALVATMLAATPDEQLTLIRAHPDLVGKLARENRLTADSTAEQRAAGLTALSPQEIALFEKYNADYRARFNFPFIICARDNKKEAILAAFPKRLQNTPETERQTALTEIAKIAHHRLLQTLTP